MSLTRIYEILIDEWGDPRSRSNIFLNTPFPVFALTFSYYYFVRVCGPKFMKNRQPYNLSTAISIYNLIQVLWNVCIVYRIVKIMMLLPFKEWTCMPLNMEDQYADNLMLSATKLYFYNKIFDFMDTIFFVLRKKFNQVSFLHIYHHVSVTILVWMIVKYSPGGNILFGTMLNAFVHIAMYIYYQMSAMKWGDTGKIKKYITQLQMVQLLTIGVHNSLILFDNHCNNVAFLNFLMAFECFYLFGLFFMFYLRAYWKKPKTK